MMPTGREVINTIKEAFDFYSELKTPWEDREVTLSYAAAATLIDWVEQLERERDAAVEDLETMGEDRAYCDTCLHNNTNSKEEPCSSCMSGYLINNWQWRGPQEVE